MGSYDGTAPCELIGIYSVFTGKHLGKRSNGFISRGWTYNPPHYQ